LRHGVLYLTTKSEALHSVLFLCFQSTFHFYEAKPKCLIQYVYVAKQKEGSKSVIRKCFAKLKTGKHGNLLKTLC